LAADDVPDVAPPSDNIDPNDQVAIDEWFGAVEEWFGSRGHALFWYNAHDHLGGNQTGRSIAIGERDGASHAQVVEYGSRPVWDSWGELRPLDSVTHYCVVDTRDAQEKRAREAEALSKATCEWFRECCEIWNRPFEPGDHVILTHRWMRALYEVDGSEADREPRTSARRERLVAGGCPIDAGLEDSDIRTEFRVVECCCGLCVTGRFVAVDEPRFDPDPDQSPWRHVSRATVRLVHERETPQYPGRQFLCPTGPVPGDTVPSLGWIPEWMGGDG
jgi:hypothetical protein